MRLSVLVANPKGGAGKSTLATNLASAFAYRGARVMLGDIDRQQSSAAWLRLRSPALPTIASWELVPGEPARPPKGATHVVLDTPAGLHGKKLQQALRVVTAVVVPVQPSLFDILATRRFLDTLLDEHDVRKNRALVGVVGMRVDRRTRAADELERFLDGLDLPILTCLRDTQNYVQTAAHGMSIFDLSLSRSAIDREQWQPVLDWLTPIDPTMALLANP